MDNKKQKYAISGKSSNETDPTHMKSLRKGIHRLHMPTVWFQTWNAVKKLLA